MIKVVSVRFKEQGKVYYFSPGNEQYEKDMGVIVETAKGLEYATVVSPECEVDEARIVSPLKPVVRIATQKDMEILRRNVEKREESIKLAQEKVNARGLEMKVIDCEFAFDGSKVTFYFTAETRVDFRELIKDLSSAFHMRIDLRQVGLRDEIKLLGGMGQCGRVCCCMGALADPQKVSVKMAKNQGLSLNPTKISGLCGRLMCCLAYENDYYSEVCKKVPKIGSEINTPDGKGTVVNVNMLKMEVKIKIEQKDVVTYHDYKVEDLYFKRGNEVFGAENAQKEEEEEPELELTTAAEFEKSAPRPEERRNEDRRNKKKKKNNRPRPEGEGQPQTQPQHQQPRQGQKGDFKGGKNQRGNRPNPNNPNQAPNQNGEGRKPKKKKFHRPPQNG